MNKTASPYAAPLVSLMLLAGVILIWYAATLPPPAPVYTPEQREYAVLMGDLPENGSEVAPPPRPSDFPTPAAFARLSWAHLSHPFYDNGPNDKGIGIQLGYSLLRVLAVICWRWLWRYRWATPSACRRFYRKPWGPISSF